VRIGFESLDPRILPDMGAKVTFMKAAAADASSDSRPVMLVPKAAIRVDNGTSYAFVVNAGSVDRRAVRTAGTDGDRLEVIAGLQAGERVIVAPPAGLVSGSTVVTK
jgi:hypothetical protein